MEGAGGVSAWRWLFYVSLLSVRPSSTFASSRFPFLPLRILYASKLTVKYVLQIEGALTMAFAVISVFILPDFPHNSRGFSAEEKELAQLRMTEDVGMKDETTVSTWTAVKLSLGDYKTWCMSLTLTAMVIGLSFNAYFPVRGPSCTPDSSRDEKTTF